MTTPPLIALHTEEPLADGKSWAHLLPAGVFTGIDGRGPYDATDAEGIVLRSRDLSGQRQMLMDYNHSSDLKKGHPEPLPAAGWIVGLQARDDGVWGLVEWTDRARATLAAREYRYLSPVIRYGASGKIEAILRASLTNTPNFDQLTALAASEENAMTDFAAKLRQLLGITTDASEADTLAAVETLKSSLNAAAEPDPARFVPIGTFQRTVAELNKLRQGIGKQSAEEHVDEQIRKGFILPAMRGWAVGLCMSNLPAFDEFITGVGPGFSSLLKRTHASHLPPSGRVALQADEAVSAVATTLGLSVEAFTTHLTKSGFERASN